jgi:lysozyme
METKDGWLVFWAAAAAVAYFIWMEYSAGPSTAQDVSQLTTSQAGQDMIKAEEGFSLTAYPDAGGYSIGWGHFGVSAGTTITQDQADDYWQQDISNAEQKVQSVITVPLTQDQFDALVSLAYNLKNWPTGAQTIIGAVNAGNFQAAIADFALYVRSQGKIVTALVQRRAAEAALFATGTP